MHIVLAVTNDISTDQRLIRTAHTLFNLPARITIIGRRIVNEPIYDDPRFRMVRMRMIFNRGPLFYAEYNLRLFGRLMMVKADLLVANDLDTLPAVFLASRIRKIRMVFDSHEYFTEVPELINRKRVKRVWEWLESKMLPKIRHACTVSLPIAQAYQRKYGIEMKVVRNLPFKRERGSTSFIQLRTGHEKIVLYQGSLNIGRGLELVIRAMQFTRNTHLVLIGKGDIESDLRQQVSTMGLSGRVTFTGRIMPDRLSDYTWQADLGLSLEEDLGLNYRFALPNKVFDYIQAGVPVLVSDLPEVRTLVEKYHIGMINTTGNAEELGTLISEILVNEKQLSEWKLNLKKAASELCWENEEPKLISLYQHALGN